MARSREAVVPALWAPLPAVGSAARDAAAAAAFPLGALAGTATILLADVEHLRAQPPLGLSFGVGVGVVGLAVGVLVEPFVLPRLVGRSHWQRARFAGIAAVYAGLVLAGGAAIHMRAAEVALQIVGAVLTGAAVRGVTASVGVGTSARPARWGRPANVADAVRLAVALVPAVALGWVAVRYVPPVVPWLAKGASVRIWHFPSPDRPTAVGYALVGAASGIWAAAKAAALAGVLRDEERRGVHATRLGEPAAVPGRPGPTTGRRYETSLLETTSLDVRYDSLQVLFDVDFHVAPGEAVALLGTNGAGKSTLLRAVTGLTPPAAGDVWFDGRRITGMPAERTNRLGLLMVPGGRGVFPTLSVADNLRVAGYRLSSSEYTAGIRRLHGAFPVLAERARQQAGLLSGGEQQMLALARAWLARPKLLAVDELTLGLAPVVVSQLLEFVRALRDEGISLVLVEQSVNVALQVCDRAYFMERGNIRFEGAASDLVARGDLLRSVFLQGAASGMSA